MSICAFDIGIKNLSYCILRKNNQKLEIVEWDLINLVSSNTMTCTYTLKNHNICGKKAAYQHPSDDKIFYCKNHSKKFQIPEMQFTIISSENKCCLCKKKSTSICDNKNYCDIHLNKLQKEFNKKNKLCKLKTHSCMKEPLADLCHTMYDVLDKLPNILNIDKIVIENQPAMDNPTMKSISIILFCYFIMKKHENIQFIAPSGKLKINSDLTKQILSSCDKKRKYAVTKKLGIQYCVELLNHIDNSDRFIKILNDSKKKDDLCDAFLHAYYHFVGSTGLDAEEFVTKITKLFEKKDDTIKLD